MVTLACANICGGCANRPNTSPFRNAMRTPRLSLPPWRRSFRPCPTRSACWLPATAASFAPRRRSADADLPDPIRLELAAQPIDAADPFLYHKTTHREVYAAALAGCREGDDVLLYNQLGEVTEATRGNLVVRCGKNLWTPPVSCGLLGGTYRARLLADGKIGERVVSLEMLPECDELFFINSVRLWRKARLVGARNARSLAARCRAKAW